MKQIVRRVAALVVGLGLGVSALAGLETVTHISDLNASWPLGSDLASTSDDHIRNIKTALKTDFPNVNGAVNPTPAQFNQLTSNTFTSAVTGNSFIPSSSTVPANGLYLPSANTIGLATNTTARGSVNSTGNWTINAPSSGSALTINGANTNQIAQFNNANAINTFVSVSAPSGTAACYSAMGNGAAFASNDLALCQNTDSSGILINRSNNPFSISLNGTVVFKALTTPALQGQGPVAGALVDMTPDTGTFTGAATGMTGTVNYSCTWSRIGKLAMLNCSGASGTSNSTSFTMTGLPSAIQPASISTRIQLNPMIIQDNGSTVGTSSIVEATIAASSGTITFLKGGLSTGWTNANAKGISSSSSITLSYLLN